MLTGGFLDMGKIISGGLDSNHIVGSVGSHTFRYTNGQLVVSEKAATVTNPRTYEQVVQRAKWLNVTALGKLLRSVTFKFAFEDKESKQTDYNMFFKYAAKMYDPVYITRDMRERGICVPAEYPVTHGSLAGIRYSYDATEQAFVTNLSASDVTENTTVEDFSIDFRRLNKSQQWLYEDKLVYVALTGTMGDDGYVHFEVSGASMLLSSDDTAKLSSVLPLLKIVNGKVAFSASEYSCIAVIHARSTENGVYVSSQEFVLSDALKTYAATFRTASAKDVSMKSIGGWNDSLIGSKASTSLNNGAVVRDDDNEESSNGSSSSSGSSENSSSNENQNENQSVEAPVISGVTPFADTTTVSMSGPDGAEIHYTTDGSQPTAESQLYSEPFTLNATTTVKAIAIKAGTASQVSTKEFTKSSGSGDNGGVEEG